MEDDALDGLIEAIKKAPAPITDQTNLEKSSRQEGGNPSAIPRPARKRTPRAKRLSKTANKSLGTMDVTGKYQGKGFTITGCGPSEGRKRSS
jgi:hypothetical protein